MGPPASALSASIQSLAVSHPAAFFSTSAAVLGLFALSPAPALAPIVLLITILRLSAHSFVPRPRGHIKGLTQAALIAAASAAAHSAPSLHALSTPNTAVAVLGALAFATSAFAVLLAFAAVRAAAVAAPRGAAWAALTLFPALWASGWGSLSQLNPVGQLVAWSPVLGLGPYEWIRPVFGQWGVDWVAAAWAVVLSEMLGDWLVARAESDEEVLVDTEPLLGEEAHMPTYGAVSDSSTQRTSMASARSRSLLVLAGALVLLMVPTYVTPSSPLPVVSPDTTPLGVACALPDPRTAGGGSGNPTLSDFIKETTTLQNRASVILWPENAVRFENPAERDDAFARIQNKTDHWKYVGVSFEEYVPATAPGAPGTRRNGFALIGHSGPPVMEYYKRNLVPIAESHSLTPGTEPPAIFTLELPAPKGIKQPKWAPGPNFTRPIPLTASICLDFAHTSAFTSLATRPALILAPARTWHASVGRAMWEQAKARAAETGATVLWCDGGAGGLSGLADARYSEVVQAGPGSWAKPVPVAHPFDARRTLYMRGGQAAAFGAAWGVVLLGGAVEFAVVRVVAGAAGGGLPGVLAALRAVRDAVQALLRRGRAKATPPVGNLLDI